MIDVMDDTPSQPIVIFAGGGTGGHIYPNLAICERLIERGFEGTARFVVSSRAIDARILGQVDQTDNLVALPVRPFNTRPWRWPGFLSAWHRSKRALRTSPLLSGSIAAIVTTGGFVSGPAMVFGARLGIPTVMVNLDAVPGIANRRMVRHASKVFSVYKHAALPTASPIGLPLRRSAVSHETEQDARRLLGLDPDRHTLMITGGSQGAASVNQSVQSWVARDDVCTALQHWQVLHICGEQKAAHLESTYKQLNIPATILPYCHTMGLAWRAATLAISRSGAGSVGEAWTNATPTVFLPFPHHKDNHQRLNADPLCDTGGALLLTDLIDPDQNADQLNQHVLPLLQSPEQLSAMKETLLATQPPDGADEVAEWVMEQLG